MFIKFGTIGTSWITEKYIDAAQKSKKWCYQSAYSRELERAKEFTKNRQVDCYDDLEKFANSGIDVVYIASPNALHFEQSKYFLEKKIHVICEKPICLDFYQFEQLLKIANENNVYIIEAIKHIHTDSFKAIKEELKNVGKIRQLNLNFNQSSSRYEDFKKGNIPNVFSREYGGGALMDLGIYPIAFCIALFGMPKDSTCKTVKLSNGIDGYGILIMEYDGFLANMSFSKITTASIYNEILGEEGSLCFSHITHQDEIFFISLAKEVRNISLSNETNNMIYEAKLFYEVINSKDSKKYAELTEISKNVMQILDKSRMQTDITWLSRS